jgi:hypothetical protein
VLALTACAVLAGVRSLPASREWIADVPPQALTTLGARPHPLFPQLRLPAETTVRPPLVRIDGDTLDQAVGRWLADRCTRAAGALRALAVDGNSLRGAAKAHGHRTLRAALRVGDGRTARISAAPSPLAVHGSAHRGEEAREPRRISDTEPARHRLSRTPGPPAGLIEGLGGSFHAVTGDDVARAVPGFAQRIDATQIVIGATRRAAGSGNCSPGG